MASVGILPPGAAVTPAPAKMVNKLAGTMTTKGTITLKDMRLPEFDRNRVIEEHEFTTFSTPYKYDLILGADFLKKMGIKLDYENLVIEWAGIKQSMNTNVFTKGRIYAFIDNYHLQLEEGELNDYFDGIDSYASSILDAKYETASADEIIQDHCSHLNQDQQDDLKKHLNNGPNYLMASWEHCKVL